MNLRVLFGDQLTREIPTLEGPELDVDVVLMAEVREEITRVPHHKQKIAFVLSAMRHFANSLRSEGFNVHYVRFDEPDNSHDLTGEVRRVARQLPIDRVIVTRPSEWSVYQVVSSWEDSLGIDVEIREDTRFLQTVDEFKTWAEGRKTMRMEHFYRVVRRKTGWLMDGDQPEGGSWNYDKQNRKSLPHDVSIPKRRAAAPDATSLEVIELVKSEFPDHPGDLTGFRWAVTRPEALDELATFVNDFLPRFGDFQDAMKTGETGLFHAMLSPYLNVGLLTAREVCLSAIDAYHSGAAPIAAVEGFVRQIAGWREFVRGIYWLSMPEYPRSNFLGASRPVPGFYWTAETSMVCMREAISATLSTAYAHHIQRLMVTGNFALLAGLAPAEVEEWYLAVYADAFEWVELPNTHGMALFADGGLFASKPYAASGAYINRMSDYCATCPFNPKKRSGPDACPFNLLYWNFLIENDGALRKNPRMAMAYRNLDRLDQTERTSIRNDAEQFLSSPEMAS